MTLLSQFGRSRVRSINSHLRIVCPHYESTCTRTRTLCLCRQEVPIEPRGVRGRQVGGRVGRRARRHAHEAAGARDVGDADFAARQLCTLLKLNTYYNCVWNTTDAFICMRGVKFVEPA